MHCNNSRAVVLITVTIDKRRKNSSESNTDVRNMHRVLINELRKLIGS